MLIEMCQTAAEREHWLKMAERMHKWKSNNLRAHVVTGEAVKVVEVLQGSLNYHRYVRDFFFFFSFKLLLKGVAKVLLHKQS